MTGEAGVMSMLITVSCIVTVLGIGFLAQFHSFLDR